jgi:hypothetical protein
MTKKAVFCIATSRNQAEQIIEHLKTERFSNNDISAVAIPGVGPFLAAGPIMAALNSAVAGANLDGLASGLLGVGIPEFQAKRYEVKVKAGNIVISVHTEEAGELARAKDIFRRAAAQNIFTSGEAFLTPSHPPATERGPRPFEVLPA